MKRTTKWLILGAVAVLSVGPSAASAQETPPPNGDVISANPFLLLFEWFNAEWEHRLAPNRTVGISGSHFSANDVSYTTSSLLLRVYPQERAPGGMFLGARAGGHYIAEDDSFFDPDEDFAFGFGIEVGYTWIFGSEQDFVLSMGAGVTRLFTDVGDTFIPNVRLVNVGWAF